MVSLPKYMTETVSHVSKGHQGKTAQVKGVDFFSNLLVQRDWYLSSLSIIEVLQIVSQEMWEEIKRHHHLYVLCWRKSLLSTAAELSCNYDVSSVPLNIENRKSGLLWGVKIFSPRYLLPLHCLFRIILSLWLRDVFPKHKMIDSLLPLSLNFLKDTGAAPPSWWS